MVSSDSDTEKERGWQDVRVKNARPPHPLTVTHVNQTYDQQVIQSFLLLLDSSVFGVSLLYCLRQELFIGKLPGGKWAVFIQC